MIKVKLSGITFSGQHLSRFGDNEKKNNTIRSFPRIWENYTPLSHF
jgi:hypothetical protein